MIKYNYTLDSIYVNDTLYPLEAYRKWLLSTHSQLCSGHFVRAVRSNGKTIFTYDWQSIYLKAEEYQFLNDYINEINSTGPSQISGDMPSGDKIF